MGLRSSNRHTDRPLSRQTALLLLALTTINPRIAGAADSPEATRPGAARPETERTDPPPAVSTEAETFAVPPVVERPLDIDAGNRIAVTSFELVDVVDRPEYEISVAEIQALVDASIPAHPEGFTVGRLQEVADEVTAYYREHGLILAQAFVPVQEVGGGVVKIEVLEGVLGRVVAEGNEMYKEKVLQRPFKDLVGQPVTNETAEAALLELTEYPGVSLFGVFQPGQQVGTADMVIKVQEENRFEGAVLADNHGIRETGRNRYRVVGTVNNLTGAGDRFSGTLQHTEQPAKSFFWAAEYERPLPFLYDTVFDFIFDRNQFDVAGDFRDRGISSDTRNASATLSKSILRSRQRNLFARVSLTRSRAETKVRGRPQSKDDITTVTTGLDYDSVDARYAGLNSGLIEITHGFNDLLGAMGHDPGGVPPSRRGGNGDFAEGNFDLVFLSYSRLQALTPLTKKLRHHSLLFRTEVQWSPDLLVPLEQYSIGGPINVRAYQPTERLYDRAWFASIEWIINAPGIADKPAFGNRTWGELVQLSFFFDMAAGVLNSPLSNEDKSDNFKGGGLGLSMNSPNVFSSKISIAWPVGTPRPRNGKDPQYWVDLNFFF